MVSPLVIKRRYLPVNIELVEDKPLNLELRPPQKKLVEELKVIDAESSFKEVLDVFLAVLNNNKSGYIVDPERVNDETDIVLIRELLDHYMGWVKNMKFDPN